MIGLTNLHKHCEDLIKNILNIIYGYKLKNLNEHTTNFPGLDLGDEGRGVAFQVSADKRSSKVNETLEKIIRYRHYETFQQIRLFVLGKKQSTYSIDVDTTPFIEFDWKTGVMDFGDILMAIQNLDSSKVKQLVALMDDELPYAISELKSERRKDGGERERLINVEATLRHLDWTYFSHSVSRIRMNGLSITLPRLLETFQSARRATDFNWLWLLDDRYRAKANGKEVVYHGAATDVGGQYKERALKMGRNSIEFEYAQYKPKDELVTDLAEELLPVVILIFLIKQLYGMSQVQLEVDFDLSSNGKLRFMSNGALFSVKPVFTDFSLNPSPLAISAVLHETDSESLLRFFEQVLGGFVTNEKGPFVPSPFMSLDEPRQKLWLDIARQKWAPTLKNL